MRVTETVVCQFCSKFETLRHDCGGTIQEGLVECSIVQSHSRRTISNNIVTSTDFRTRMNGNSRLKSDAPSLFGHIFLTSIPIKLVDGCRDSSHKFRRITIAGLNDEIFTLHFEGMPILRFVVL